MTKITAISRLLRVKTHKSRHFYEFHFKGFFRGMKIKKIILISRKPLNLKVKEDYLLNLDFLFVKDEKLISKLLDHKSLENISW